MAAGPAVASFLAGGRAALEAIERAGYEVLARAAPGRRGRRLLAFGAIDRGESGRRAA